MNMYNLIEYSDNYSESTASLYHFKRQEALENNANLRDASTSFYYKSKPLENATAENGNAIWKNAKIIVPLKYISSFFRSLEMPLINKKLYIELNYSKNFIISNIAGLHVPVVTLKTEDNNKLNQLLDSEFKRKMYWNEYKSKIEDVTQAAANTVFKRSLLDAKTPGVNRLFVAAFPDPALRNSHRRYFFTINKY